MVWIAVGIIKVLWKNDSQFVWCTFRWHLQDRVDEWEQVPFNWLLLHSSVWCQECSALRQPPGGVSELDLDSLGRPAIYSSYQRPRDTSSWREKQKEESQRRVESFLKSSDHSLVNTCLCACVWQGVCVYLCLVCRCTCVSVSVWEIQTKRERK